MGALVFAVFTLDARTGGHARLGTRLSGTQAAVLDGLAWAAEFAVLVIVVPTADKSLPTPATVLQPVTASAAAAMIAIFVIIHPPPACRLARLAAKSGEIGKRVGRENYGEVMTTSWWTPIALLIGSNVFMTTAWYGHLKFRESPIMLAILASWGIAFIEYCMAVPANRIGRAVYSTAELKTMQEVITLVVFVFFSVFVLKEPITLKHGVGFALIAAGAAVVFYKG